ncbi:MAG: fibronectin type III domain-containing protein [Candidatus Heimdallarchaeaceae archaeon]
MKLKSLRSLLIIILIITPLVITFQLAFAQETDPRFVHLSWQNDTATTMTISWQTTDETSSIVQYGADVSYGNEDTGDFVSGAAGIWHHVELTGLSPDTIYHYRVGDGETWSKDYTFKTGTTGKHAKFVAWGDSRHNRPERRELMNTVNTLDFDFSMFNGDLVDDGDFAIQWPRWFSDFAPILNRMPFMSVMGSHEQNHSNYYDAFAFPGIEEYYSFNYGPIHFICLHSEPEYYGVTWDEQVDWIIDDLALHQDYEWKIVVQHQPAYSSSFKYESGDYDDILNLLVPIYEENNISMVLSGHDHFYERLHKNNITYVVTGGAGAPLYDVVEALIIEESAYAESVNHAVLIEVNEDQIDMRAFRTDRSLMDQYTLNKVDKPDLRCNTLPFSNKITKGVDLQVNITIKNIGEVNITEETTARVLISNGETWDITVPALDVYESVDFTYVWSAPESELYTWTITTDVNGQIDEVVEDNNQVIFTFDATEPESSSFFVEGIWGLLATLGSIMVAAVIMKRRKK